MTKMQTAQWHHDFCLNMQSFLPTVQGLDDAPNVVKYNVIRILVF